MLDLLGTEGKVIDTCQHNRESSIILKQRLTQSFEVKLKGLDSAGDDGGRHSGVGSGAGPCMTRGQR